MQLIDLCSCCLDVHRLELKEELQAVSANLILVSLNYIIKSAIQNQWIQLLHSDVEGEVLDTRLSMSYHGHYLVSSTILEEPNNDIESIIKSGGGRVSVLVRDSAYLSLGRPSAIIIPDKQYLKLIDAYSNFNSVQPSKPTKLIRTIIHVHQALRCPIISSSSFIDCVRRASSNLPQIIRYIPLSQQQIETKDKEIQELKNDKQKLIEHMEGIIKNNELGENHMKQQLIQQNNKINRLDEQQVLYKTQVQQQQQAQQQRFDEQQQQHQHQQQQQQAEQQRLTKELQLLQGQLAAKTKENQTISTILDGEKQKTEQLTGVIKIYELNEQNMKKQINEQSATIDRLNEEQSLNEQHHQEQQQKYNEQQIEHLVLKKEFESQVELLSSIREENKQLAEKVNKLNERLNDSNLYKTIIQLSQEGKTEADRRSDILFHRCKIQELIFKQTIDTLRAEHNAVVEKLHKEMTLEQLINSHLYNFAERIGAEFETLRHNHSQVIADSTNTAEEVAKVRAEENDEDQAQILDEHVRELGRLTNTYMGME